MRAPSGISVESGCLQMRQPLLTTVR
ncbi:hypothetical protein SAMN05421850_1286, partial [Lutimaribacter saemankumensis]